MTSIRETILLRQEAAGLPIGDVVFAVQPNGEKSLVWGRDLLEAIVQVNTPQEVMVINVAVGNMAEADALAHRYWTACDDAEGSA